MRRTRSFRRHRTDRCHGGCRVSVSCPSSWALVMPLTTRIRISSRDVYAQKAAYGTGDAPVTGRRSTAARRHRLSGMAQVRGA